MEYYKVKDICKIFDISRQAVHRWINDGKINVIRLPGKQIRIAKEEIEKLKEAK